MYLLYADEIWFICYDNIPTYSQGILILEVYIRYC